MKRLRVCVKTITCLRWKDYVFAMKRLRVCVDKITCLCWKEAFWWHIQLHNVIILVWASGSDSLCYYGKVSKKTSPGVCRIRSLRSSLSFGHHVCDSGELSFYLTSGHSLPVCDLYNNHFSFREACMSSICWIPFRLVCACFSSSYLNLLALDGYTVSEINPGVHMPLPLGANDSRNSDPKYWSFSSDVMRIWRRKFWIVSYDINFRRIVWKKIFYCVRGGGGGARDISQPSKI